MEDGCISCSGVENHLLGSFGEIDDVDIKDRPEITDGFRADTFPNDLFTTECNTMGWNIVTDDPRIGRAPFCCFVCNANYLRVKPQTTELAPPSNSRSVDFVCLLEEMVYSIGDVNTIQA